MTAHETSGASNQGVLPPPESSRQEEAVKGVCPKAGPAPGLAQGAQAVVQLSLKLPRMEVAQPARATCPTVQR